MENPWNNSRRIEPGKTSRPPIFTQVPGSPPIELVAYYDEFRDYYPECEMDTKGWFVRNVRRDWVMLDCGANIGYYTILFAQLASEGHIYAFEPTITYEMLLTNLAHHQINNVTPLKLALGKSTGQIEDSIFRIWGTEPEKMVYPFTTIDDFMATNQLPRLDCIKIDVDSFDFEVLQGARGTLIKHDPFVVVELNHALSRRNQSVPQALEWLAGMGYKAAFCLDYDNFLLKRNSPSGDTGTTGLQITIQFGQKQQDNLDLTRQA